MEKKNKRRIYVASSWRNTEQENVVSYLRIQGHNVYDFKKPMKGDNGFHWSDIDPEWKDWTSIKYRSFLDNPIAIKGFNSDFDAMKWADTFILVQPCGRSAHLELGWACGAGKKTAILLRSGEPELMVKMVDCLAVNYRELDQWIDTL
jgi:hypothetical protein